MSENPFGAKDADGFRASRPLWGRRRIAEILYGADADLARLQGLTVAVIGYGIQGRAQALNIRDSGVKNVAVGSVRDESWKQAEKRLREALGTAYGEEESGA